MLTIAGHKPEGGRLGFTEAVLKNFYFMNNHGFQVVRTEPTFVRYESHAVFVNVYHGRASYVIGVEIGRLDRSQKYDLAYIVSNAGEDAWKTEGFGRSTMFQVSSSEGVMEFVPKVAELIKKYGGEFLSGDPLFYDQFEIIGKHRAIEFAKKQNLTHIRRSAEVAWVNKDFAKVAELYGFIGNNDLTEIEKKRLSYSQKSAKKNH